MKRGDLPSISGLTSFVSAAQHGSFTRAGNELNLTQGAISRQIQELESHLGIRLFERIRQRVILTDAGKLYLPHVKKALSDLSDATHKVVSLSNSAALNLVVLPTFGARWLIPRLSKFQGEHPGISIHITTLQQPIDCDLQPYDVAVFHQSNPWPGTISHHLMDADMLAVCSPKLKARQAIKTPADLARFPLLRERKRPNRWCDLLAGLGVTLETPLTGDTYQNFGMLAQAAVAGLGVALLPVHLVADDIERRRLEVVGGRFLKAKTSYYLILPEARASNGAVRTFTEWLIAECRAWQSDIPTPKKPNNSLVTAASAQAAAAAHGRRISGSPR